MCPSSESVRAPETDGQILVMHDILGVTHGRTPRFVKNFMAEASNIQEAFEHYHQAVKQRTFPAPLLLKRPFSLSTAF